VTLFQWKGRLCGFDRYHRVSVLCRTGARYETPFYACSRCSVPRGMEFLYSRNRINVAVSRAKSLAIIVASPRLLEAPCMKIEQMVLVNTLCYASAYAGVNYVQGTAHAP
jgi:hypothetical protein